MHICPCKCVCVYCSNFISDNMMHCTFDDVGSNKVSSSSSSSSLTDTAVKTVKRRASEATQDKVNMGDDVLENVLNFVYLGSRLQCDGDDQVDIRHRMDIAQVVFGSLIHIWTDHRLSRETKLHLYKLSVCSS